MYIIYIYIIYIIYIYIYYIHTVVFKPRQHPLTHSYHLIYTLYSYTLIYTLSNILHPVSALSLIPRLPFFHSSILPFFHSSILPFFHSSILPFFHFFHFSILPQVVGSTVNETPGRASAQTVGGTGGGGRGLMGMFRR